MSAASATETPPPSNDKPLDMKLLGIVFLTVTLDLIGFGIIIPIQPFYAERFGATATQVTLLGASYSLMQFLFTPLWGRLSDRVGRRPVMLVSIAAAAIGFTVFGLSGSLWMLFSARILSGIGTANIGTAQAIIADITAPKDRARGMGFIGMAFGLGFIVGPLLGGVFSQFGLATPAFIAAGLSALNWLIAYAKLPETHTPGTVKEVHGRRGLGLSPAALKHALSFAGVGAVLWLYLMVTLGFSQMEQVIGLFIEDVWVPGAHTGATPEARDALARQATQLTTWMLLVVGVAAAVVQGGLIGRLVARFGERTLVIAGTALMAVGLLLTPLTAAMPYASILGIALILAVGSGITNPSMSALLSQAVPADEQGAVLGVGQSLSALGRVLGPAIAGVLFEMHIGLPFLTAGVLVATCTLAALRIPKRST